jgi:hypothetical protein
MAFSIVVLVVALLPAPSEPEDVEEEEPGRYALDAQAYEELALAARAYSLAIDEHADQIAAEEARGRARVFPDGTREPQSDTRDRLATAYTLAAAGILSRYRSRQETRPE